MPSPIPALKQALLTVELLPRTAPRPPLVPPELDIDAPTDPVGAPRFCDGIVTALDREGTLYAREGDRLHRWETPGKNWFSIAPDLSEAWVVGRAPGGRGDDGTIRWAPLDEAPQWQTIRVENLSHLGLDGLARLDADHIVVKSYDHLELIGRSDGAWSTLHSVKCPTQGPLRPFHGHDAVLLLSKGKLIVYGRKKGRLTKLNAVKITPQRFQSMLPEAWFTPDGTLWLANGRLWRVSIGAPAVCEQARA